LGQTETVPVAAAYGWPADLSDDEILRRLLDLNLARAVAPGRAPVSTWSAVSTTPESRSSASATR